MDKKGTLRQWNGWSMRNGWVNRAAEHDSDLASRRRERMAQELERAQDDAVVLIKPKSTEGMTMQQRNGR